ncbi:MAG: hypothetical protein KAR11_06255 [Phycisphaerae bacterium]|nr:hypothetical protein [Phycisphaerae bacterium]
MNYKTHLQTSKFSLPVLISLLGALMLTSAGGCGNGEIISRNENLPKSEDSAGFLDRVSSLPVVTEDDAMRGILMLINGDDTAESFPQRVRLLQERGILPNSWDYVSDRAITRGKYAYMIYQAAKFRGGIVLSLTGASRRYCLRELQFQKVMTNGPMLSEISGMEYIAVLGRADTYIRTGHVPNRSGETRDEQQLEIN